MKFGILNCASSRGQEDDGGSYEPIKEEYIGETNDQGQRDGKGRYLFRNGNWYDGEWKCDEMHGYGVWICLNGVKYEGQFKEGKPREIRRSENGKRTRLLTRDELRELPEKLKGERIHEGRFLRLLRRVKSYFRRLKAKTLKKRKKHRSQEQTPLVDKKKREAAEKIKAKYTFRSTASCGAVQ